MSHVYFNHDHDIIIRIPEGCVDDTFDHANVIERALHAGFVSFDCIVFHDEMCVVIQRESQFILTYNKG
ncbi:hypothetical protein [Caudoviricetes sp.]|nr:hypothetical protein [Caudoviricetes sp.]